MTQTKEEVIHIIEQMPDDAGVADIMAGLYFRQKVDEGLKELGEGNGIPHEQGRERFVKRRS